MAVLPMMNRAFPNAFGRALTATVSRDRSKLNSSDYVDVGDALG